MTESCFRTEYVGVWIDDPDDVLSPPVSAAHVGQAYRDREVALATIPVMTMLAERPMAVEQLRDNLPISYATLLACLRELSADGHIAARRGGVWRVTN